MGKTGETLSTNTAQIQLNFPHSTHTSTRDMSKLLPAFCFDNPLLWFDNPHNPNTTPSDLDNGVPISTVCGHGCLVVNSQVLLAAVHDGLVNMGVQAAAG